MIQKKKKEGRPPANNGMVSKSNDVYAAIPDDGSRVRFKDLVERLKPMARSTIAQALSHGVYIGLLVREQQSKKNVFYYKDPAPSFRDFNMFNKFLDEELSSGTDVMEVYEMYVSNLRPSAKMKLMEIQKNKNDSKLVLKTQAAILTDELKFIDIFLLKLLLDYSKDHDRNNTNNMVQFVLLPHIKDMIDLVDEYGLDESIVLAVLKSSRRSLRTTDFINEKELEFIKKE